MPHERSLPTFILLFWLLTINPSCVPSQPSEEKTSGDRLVLAAYQKIAPINPILSSTTLSARLIDIVFDGLIRLNRQLVPQPHLAESWERSQDGRIWTFQIRKGVTFHDGEALTAEDIAFTYETMKRLKGQVRWSHIFQEIDQITVIDTHVLQVTLKEPIAAFLQVLDVGILPKHLLAGKDLTKLPTNQNLIGTGSYKLKSWSEQEIRLEAHADYFLGVPHIDEIHLKVYPNQEAAWARLMAGEVDYFDYHTPARFEILQQMPGFHIYTFSNPFYYLVAFNLQDAIFEDHRVRQALNYASNKEEILTKVLKDQGKIAAGTIYPGSWAYNSQVKAYPYRPQKALALLKEAGWEDHDGDHMLDKEGKTLQFTVHVNAGDEIKKKAILLIQQQLLEIGIQVDVQFFDAADIDFLLKKRFQALFVEMVALPDPDSSYIFWHATQIRNGFNVSSYSNNTVNQLLEAGRTELDPDKRKALYFQYQEEMLKDPPGIFLFWTNRLVGVHQRFEGVKIGPASPFANIHEWTVPKAQQRVAKAGNKD